MSISDSDLELLETLLDGELPEADAAVLQRRIIFEPALATAMETLRSERAMRAKVWMSMEPSNAAMARVEAHVDRKVHGHLNWAKALTRLRMVSAAAACIVVGVMVGRFGNLGRNDVAQPTEPGTIVASNNGSPTVKAPGPMVEVPIVDEYGTHVATVRMPEDKASEMTEDFRRENERQSGPNGGAVLTNAPAEGKF